MKRLTSIAVGAALIAAWGAVFVASVSHAQDMATHEASSAAQPRPVVPAPTQPAARSSRPLDPQLAHHVSIGGKGTREHHSGIYRRDLDLGAQQLVIQQARVALDNGAARLVLWCPWGDWPDSQIDGKIPILPPDPVPGWTGGLLKGIAAAEGMGVEVIVYVGDPGTATADQIDRLFRFLGGLRDIGRRTLVIYDHTSSPTDQELAIMNATRDIYRLRVGVESLPVEGAPSFDAVWVFSQTALRELGEGRRLHARDTIVFPQWDAVAQQPRWDQVEQLAGARSVTISLNLRHQPAEALARLDAIEAARGVKGVGR